MCAFCVEGDSLVPVWSATLGDSQPNRTIYAKNVDHMDLIDNDECLNYISNLIRGHTALPVDGVLSQEMILES